MASTQDHIQALARLKEEFDRTLENIGRLYATSTSGTKASTNAHAARLKSQLPTSIHSFHEALDLLEDDLQLAQAVMRRDLAVLREQASQQRSPAQTEAIAPMTPISNGVVQGDAMRTDMKPDDQKGGQEVQMQEAEPVAPEAPSEPVLEPPMEDRKPAEDDLALDPAPEVSPTQPTTAPDPQADDLKPSDTALQLKTETTEDDDDLLGDAGTAIEDEKPPDTATISDTRDLDSLFNDPVSADAAVGSGEANPDFTSGFDFGTFNATLDNHADDNDNDNLEGLLPGLQDYANTQPTETNEADFDALFAPDPPADGHGQVGNGMQQSGGEQRDTTFDDIMNFADFDGGDYGNGGEGGENNNSEDFDFNFD